MVKEKNTSAASLCEEAAKLVSGNREKQHGDKEKNLQNIAVLWSAYLSGVFPEYEDVNLLPSEVAAMMALLKIARTLTGETNKDDYVDMIGYASIAGELTLS